MNKELHKIAKALSIKAPKLEIVDDLPGTQLAAADIDRWCIYLRKELSDRRDAFFALAHEARHLWQAKNGMKFSQTRIFQDKNAYNLLPEELDANAFATAYMLTKHSVKPLFTGLREDVRNLIYEKAAEMMKK